MNINMTLDYEALNRTIGGIKLLRKFDATPLMLAWQKIAIEGNQRGILAGLDAFGVPINSYAPIRYRPKGAPKKVTTPQRLGVKGTKRGLPGGFGPLASGLHNNLSTAEYLSLAGPPLAPRGRYSRVITNFMTDFDKLPSGNWQVTYWWEDVVSVEGFPFLKVHFEGLRAGRRPGFNMPRRDLRGIRPADQAKITKATEAWSRDMLRSAFDPAAPYMLGPPIV